MKEKSRSKMKRGLIVFLLALPLVLYGTLSRPQAPSPVSGGATQSASATSDPSYSGAQVINVVNFGAAGNGSTDDTAAINSAIKACSTRAFPFNGCSLYFPSGIYITTGLTVPSYVHIRGDGWATSVIRLKPETAADVLTIPAGTFNFSITGVTLDGNAQHQSTGGNCFSTAETPSGPNSINTANKRTASSNGYKDGLIYGVMFSNCTANGINIVAYNYELWFDDFFTYNNGIYGIYTQGTDSLFSNFVSERNGTSGVHVSNSNNKFINAKVIWNGFRNRSEGAVFTNADRNIFTSVETQDNYVSGFVDQGSDNQFIGCQADTNGYANRSNNASSRKASGFVISGVNGVYSGDKVTDYRGRLADGNYATEWPYTLTNPAQSRIDISYDGTNQPPPTKAPGATILSSVGTGALGHAACIKSSGPPVVIGFCSSKINSAGICTCN
jgi:polygalacturonase